MLDITNSFMIHKTSWYMVYRIWLGDIPMGPSQSRPLKKAKAAKGLRLLRLLGLLGVLGLLMLGLLILWILAARRFWRTVDVKNVKNGWELLQRPNSLDFISLMSLGNWVMHCLRFEIGTPWGLERWGCFLQEDFIARAPRRNKCFKNRRFDQTFLRNSQTSWNIPESCRIPFDMWVYGHNCGTI